MLINVRARFVAPLNKSARRKSGHVELEPVRRSSSVVIHTTQSLPTNILNNRNI